MGVAGVSVLYIRTGVVCFYFSDLAVVHHWVVLGGAMQEYVPFIGAHSLRRDHKKNDSILTGLLSMSRACFISCFTSGINK